MSGAKDKIKQYLDYKGISRNKFYTVTGFSMGFLESGVSMGVDKVKIIISHFPDINTDWLVLDQGEMIKTSRSPNTENTTISQNEHAVHSEITNELLKTKDELIEIQRKYIVILETKAKNLTK